MIWVHPIKDPQFHLYLQSNSPLWNILDHLDILNWLLVDMEVCAIVKGSLSTVIYEQKTSNIFSVHLELW